MPLILASTGLLANFTMNDNFTAAIWIGLALLASMISIKSGISVALVEILIGVIGGNFLHLQSNAWIAFLAGFGSVLLTFLAGAEIDLHAFRRHLKASLAIGGVSFFAPFLGIWALAYWGAHWNFHASEIAGNRAFHHILSPSSTPSWSETGLNRDLEIGKLILAACFITDLGDGAGAGG